ncbi:MAG: divalent-cation tolerance protein CutA [Desulfobacteraceae bacterium]|nr:divalent-cation tolerance protein CutA [Desulfobacteraceae bacterium]
MKYYLIYVTASDKDEARRIGRYLVQNRLAAGVNIIDHMNSMYYWKGEFRDSNEAVLIAKTSKAKKAAAMQTVRSMHSYQCPCVLCFTIDDGDPAFLKWIHDQTG